MPPISPHRTQAPLHAAIAAACLVACLPARADPDPYALGVIQSLEHDSNVFRAQDGGDVVADWISTTGLIGTVFQAYGRHAIKLDGEFDINRFDHQKQLNSTAHSVKIRGDWSTIDRLSGDWGASNSSQLYRNTSSSVSTDAQQGAMDTLRVTQSFADLHLGVVTPLTIDASAHTLNQRYSLEAYKVLDLQRWDALLGATYRTTPDLNVSLSYRHTHGKYPSYGDEFSRNDAVLGLFYAPSALTQFNAHVSEGRENHTLINSRSSQTFAADANWFWQATGRTQLNLNFVHDDDTGTTETPFFFGELANNDARKHTAISASATYEVSAKINAVLKGAFARRVLDSAFSADPSLNTRGSDRLYTASFELDYAPTRLSKLSCSAARERRTVRGDTQSLTFPYGTIIYSCSGQISFN